LVVGFETRPTRWLRVRVIEKEYCRAREIDPPSYAVRDLDREAKTIFRKWRAAGLL